MKLIESILLLIACATMTLPFFILKGTAIPPNLEPILLMGLFVGSMGAIAITILIIISVIHFIREKKFRSNR